jgi:hypothetical protein
LTDWFGLKRKQKFCNHIDRGVTTKDAWKMMSEKKGGHEASNAASWKIEDGRSWSKHPKDVRGYRKKKERRKKSSKKFDSTLGYPGEGPDEERGLTLCVFTPCAASSHFHTIKGKGGGEKKAPHPALLRILMRDGVKCQDVKACKNPKHYHPEPRAPKFRKDDHPIHLVPTVSKSRSAHAARPTAQKSEKPRWELIKTQPPQKPALPPRPKFRILDNKHSHEAMAEVTETTDEKISMTTGQPSARPATTKPKKKPDMHWVYEGPGDSTPVEEDSKEDPSDALVVNPLLRLEILPPGAPDTIGRALFSKIEDLPRSWDVLNRVQEGIIFVDTDKFPQAHQQFWGRVGQWFASSFVASLLGYTTCHTVAKYVYPDGSDTLVSGATPASMTESKHRWYSGKRTALSTFEHITSAHYHEDCSIPNRLGLKTAYRVQFNPAMFMYFVSRLKIQQAQVLSNSGDAIRSTFARSVGKVATEGDPTTDADLTLSAENRLAAIRGRADRHRALITHWRGQANNVFEHTLAMVHNALICKEYRVKTSSSNDAVPPFRPPTNLKAPGSSASTGTVA